MPRREDAVAQRPGAPGRRTLILAGGFVLAGAATLAVFLTDNPQFLRIAVVAVAWAFVLATFAAGRRGPDRAVAAAREEALHRAYELELEREVAARREYELELENELRRETEDSVRHELDALRGDIAALSGLRDEVARVSALRGDITALTGLRDEIARVAALHDDVVALNSLREELGQLAELRADMGRLRAELTEQLSSEMLVERIVMRTQASRLPGEPARLESSGRSLDSGQSWTDDVPPRELTGGWPAVRLDEPRETQQFEQVRVERATSRPPVPQPPAPAWEPPSWEPPAWEKPSWEAPSWEPPSWERPSWETPGTSTWAASPPPPAPPAFTAPPPVPPRPSPTPRTVDPAEPPLWSSAPDAARSRHESDAGPRTPPTTAFPLTPSQRPRPSAPPPTALTPIAPPPVTPAEPPPSPLEWLAARSLSDASPTSARPDVPPRRRRSDDEPVDLASAPTEQRPAAVPVVDRGGYRVAVRAEEPLARHDPAARGNRVADILADNGVSPSTGGRRRRRYRDDDEPDDVLARVLGQG